MFYYDSNRFLKRVSIMFLFLVRHHFSRQLSTLKVLQKRYGNVVVRNVKEFEKIHFKYRKMLLDINFVNTCFKSNIIPKFCSMPCFQQGLKKLNGVQTMTSQVT